MFPSGSKLLFGGAVLALVAAVVYGVTQEGSLGTVGLISASLGLFLLAGVNLYIRDADVSPMDTGALTHVQTVPSDNAFYFAFDPTQRFLYAVNVIGD